MTQTTLRDYLQTTEDAISSGRVNDAFANCQYILTYYPDSLEAQRLLGEIYLAQGRLEEAQQTFDWVLTNDPENVVAYCSRALISERMSDYDTALDCYQQAYELSRGNSSIRQEFNQLSIKVGQQHFIFSRAGLARLYMRGDLLPQAIQEWETVLSSNPERLDARTGLVETYWREGLYDRVEQLAHQILNDVPGCLKALLLLSHVTFARNIQESKRHLERAEALDPDMVMAQELFGDFIASNPKDPFLALLKKAPSVFATSSEEMSQLAGTHATSEPAYIPNGNGKHHEAEHPTPNPHETWSNLNTTAAPQVEYQPMQEASPYAAWGNSDSVEFVPRHAFNASQQGYHSSSEGLLDNEQEEPMAIESFDLTAVDFDDHATPEMRLIEREEEEDDDQDATLMSDLSHRDQQPWYPVETLDIDTLDEPEAEQWNAMPSGATWEADEQESDLPAPPAWLDMLTRGERPSSSGSLPKQAVQPAPTQPQQMTPAEQPTYMSWMDQLHTTPSTHLQQEQPLFAPVSEAAEQEEDEFFGPEWLKSLGATALDSTSEQEAETSAPAPTASTMQETEPEPETESVMVEQPDTFEQPAFSTSAESWLDQMRQQLSQPTEQHQHVLATLEALEDDLRSQGFTPLEPGALSSIAQDTSLSSALAHFGEFEPASQSSQPVGEEHLVEESAQSDEPTVALDLPSIASTDASTDTPIWPNTTFELEMTMPAALVSHSAFLDSELETTMKRPAVRLQPMPRPSMQPAAQQQVGKGHSSDYVSSQKTDGTLSYKERLIRGYHYQLAGAYDDAMQEYRIIIRNAPELLDEVISNMRALLKLASKYSAGYRVLGDAYMRQGEYLQAMEAYNKALTMAKKAKG